MKTSTIACLLALLWSVPVSAQSVYADRFVLATGPCTIRSGSGVPAPGLGSNCDKYVDTTSAPFGVWYDKIGGVWYASVTTLTFSGFANPSQTIDLSTHNGSATTGMRSDAAPALSQSISPLWAGTHVWTNANPIGGKTSGGTSVSMLQVDLSDFVKLGDTAVIAGVSIYGGSSTESVRVTDQKLTIQGTAPLLQMTDSTASAKSMLLKTDANVSCIYDTAGTAGDGFCQDLTNKRVGIGKTNPGTLFDVNGTGTFTTVNSVAYQESGVALATTHLADVTAPVDVSFSAGNFTGGGAQTWTLTSGDQATFTYAIVGKIMTIWFDFATTSVGGTPNPDLKVTLPASKSAAKAIVIGGIFYSDNGGANAQGIAYTTASGTTLNFEKNDTSNWTAATNTTRITGTVTIPIN